MSLRILVTGSRDWTDRDAIRDALLRAVLFHGPAGDVTVVHGGARGADTIAGNLAVDHDWQVEVHPADWTSGPAAGPVRNRLMVDLGADICLAFPLGKSAGTRGCVALAERAGIPVVITEGDPS